MDNERKRTSYVTKDPPKSARDQKRNYKRHKRNYNRDVTNAKLELEQNLIKQEMSREVHTNRKTPGQSTQGAKAQSGTDRERTEMRLTKRSEVPRGHKIIKTKFVYKIKQNKDGTIQKYKSRLIAQGFLLRWGVDYFDTYSSVVGYNSLRTLLAISASTGEKFSQADIGNAYIESSPDDDTPVYVEQAPGLEEMDPEEYVYRHRKSLYGMPFSGRTFQRVMEEFMDKI